MGHDVMLGQGVDEREDAKRRKHLFQNVNRAETANIGNDNQDQLVHSMQVY